MACATVPFKIWLGLGLICSLSACVSKISVPHKNYTFANARIIAIETGEISEPTSIVVTGKRIVSIGGDNDAAPIDLGGRYVIPGLWDMHAHALKYETYENDLDLMVAYGVTGFRDMWGDLGVAELVRTETLSGNRTAPRFVVTGALIDGDPNIHIWSNIAATPEEARAIVRRIKAEGGEFIKPYSNLSRGAYLALADEAKKQGLPVWGHTPIGVSGEEAVRAGQTSLEHAFGIRCSEYQQQLDAITASEEFKADPWNSKWDADFRRYGEEWNPEVCVEFFDLLNQQGVHVTPTLTTSYAYSRDVFSPPLEAPRYAYQDARLVGQWLGLAREDGNENPELRRFYSERLRKRTGLVPYYRDHGVPILAGADNHNPWIVAGVGLHDELALLVRHGLSARAALASATTTPAKFLGRESDFGDLAAGKHADFIVLNANPLEDINASRDIYAVMINGQYLTRKDLDAILSRVERRTDWQLLLELIERAKSESVEAALALAATKQSVGLRPDDLIGLARYLEGRGARNSALAVLIMSTKWFSDSWLSFAELGAVYAERNQDGDKERAITVLEYALKIGPPDTYTQQLIENLRRP